MVTAGGLMEAFIKKPGFKCPICKSPNFHLDIIKTCSSKRQKILTCIDCSSELETTNDKMYILKRVSEDYSNIMSRWHQWYRKKFTVEELWSFKNHPSSDAQLFPVNKGVDRTTLLLAEHQTAQDYALHVDSLYWTIGSILISGAMIFLGWIIQTGNIDPCLLGVSLCLVNSIPCIWLLYTINQLQIYWWKALRVRRIEKELGMKQNYFWKQGIYRTIGPGGKTLNILLVGAIWLATVFYEITSIWWRAQKGVAWSNHMLLFILSFVMYPATIIWYWILCKRFKKYKEFIKV
jgi:hypothetical protein